MLRWRPGTIRAGLVVLVSLLAAAAVPLASPTPAAAGPEADQFIAVPPVTVANNLSVAAGGSVRFQVTGAGGIPAPANVSAVALSVTASLPSATGYLQAYPAGPRPSGNATLNFQQGQTTAGFEVVPISPGGLVSVYSTVATRLLGRVRGYYSSTPTPAGASWSQFHNGPAHLGVNPQETVLGRPRSVAWAECGARPSAAVPPLRRSSTEWCTSARATAGYSRCAPRPGPPSGPSPPAGRCAGPRRWPAGWCTWARWTARCMR